MSKPASPLPTPRLGPAALAAACLVTAAVAEATPRPPSPAPDFAALDRAIDAGEFPKLGSVVVERGGEVVYERYVVGDAATLRDTRSATKTITGMLVGAAIADGELAGVDARVLPFFAERTIARPDPRKAAMFEDLARNLTVPHALGMTTVLVVPDHTREIFREGWELEGRDAAHVDHVTDDLAAFLRTIAAPA